MSASSEHRRQRAGLVRRWAWALSLGASLCTLTTRGAAAAPLWPSAGDAARRTLNDPASPPEVGVSIVEASDSLHPAAASALLASAAMNPSRAVRRAAVLRCAQRRLIACLPAAITQWRRGLDPDPESRAAYLALLRLFIDERVAAILVDALHAPDPDLRAAVASSLLDAPLSDAVRPAILEALTARAADKIPMVRAAVLPTLSALDPTGRPAALLQGLDDPEPLVRASAATAVGRLADRRFAPRLLAMLEAPSTPDIAAAVLTALAGTPGPEVDAALLRFLEAPPTHLSQSSVAWAIARRGPFSRTTLEALLSLLDDPTLTDTVSRTLAGNLSPDDLTEIRARLRTRARVRPSSRTALRALLDASGPWTDAPSEPSAPSATAGAGFLEIQRTRALRVAHAFENPPTSEMRAGLRLFRALASAPELPTTEALLWRFVASPRSPSTAPPPVHSGDRRLGRAELERWTLDPARAPSTRCAALWATLRSAEDRRERRAAWALASRHLASGAEMRHCAALALAMTDAPLSRQGEPRDRGSIARARRHIFTRSLLDRDPRVRAAALVSGWLHRAPDMAVVLRRARRDSHPRVRQLASALTVSAPPRPRRSRALLVVRPSTAAQHPTHGWLWARLENTDADGSAIPVPTLPYLPLAILPNPARTDVPPLERIQ